MNIFSKQDARSVHVRFLLSFVILFFITLGFLFYIQPVSAVAPSAPTNLSVDVGYDRVRLSWTAPSGSITGYDYSDDNGSSWTAIPDSDSTTTSYIVPDLDPGTLYRFKVRAKNTDGNGTASGTKTVRSNKFASGVSTLAFDNSDFFGTGVSVSSDGNTLAIGVYNYDTDTASNSGAAHIFSRDEATGIWSLDLTIDGDSDFTGFSLSAGGNFGSSVALSSDGNNLVVGARNAEPDGQANGAVYLFSRSGDTWSYDTTITDGFDSDALSLYLNDAFGSAVALSSDGDILVVGALNVDGKGAVYLFSRSGDTWSYDSIIDENFSGLTLDSFDQFGTSVALSPDNNTLAVGAIRDYNDDGAVHIFSRDEATDTWSHSTAINNTFVSSEENDGNNPVLGSSVAFSQNGHILFVGFSGIHDQAGSVYVFTKDGTTWSYDSEITGSTSDDFSLSSGDAFGFSVTAHTSSLDDNSVILISGAYTDDTGGTNRGAAYILGTDIFIDDVAPTLSTSDAIGTTIDQTPSFVFTSNEAGTISYEGSCDSDTTEVSVGENTIVFNSLNPGTYSDCAIVVSDSNGNSTTLAIDSFTVIREPQISWNADTDTVVIELEGATLSCTSSDFYIDDDGQIFIGEDHDIDCDYEHPFGTLFSTRLFVASGNYSSAANTDIGSLTTITDDTTAILSGIDAYIGSETIENDIGFGTGSNAEYLRYFSNNTGEADSILLSNTEGHHIDAVTDDADFTIHTINDALVLHSRLLFIGLYNFANTDLTDESLTTRAFVVHLQDDDFIPDISEDISDYVYEVNKSVETLQLPEVSSSRPVTYSISTLPNGLVFDASDRTITGMPTIAGSTEVTYTATGIFGGKTGTQTFTITVIPDDVFEDPVWWLRADRISGSDADAILEWESETSDPNPEEEVFTGTILDMTITPTAAVGDEVLTIAASDADSAGTVATITTGSLSSDGYLVPESGSGFEIDEITFSTTSAQDEVYVGNSLSSTVSFANAHSGDSIYFINDLGTYEISLDSSEATTVIDSDYVSGCGCGSGTTFSIADNSVLNEIRQNRTAFRFIIADSDQSFVDPSPLVATAPTTTDHRPQYSTDGINGIPAVSFDGSNDYLLFDIDAIKDGSGSYSFFALAQMQPNTDPSVPASSAFPIIGSDDNAADSEFFFGYDDIFSSGSDSSTILFSQNIGTASDGVSADVSLFESDDADVHPSILLLENDAEDSALMIQEIRNGTAETAVASFLSPPTSSFQDYIGRYSNSYAKMNLGDLFVYEDELSVVQEEQVQTYFALKYNITLSDESRYINSNGSVLYDGSDEDSTYVHNIAGIGRDVLSDITITSATSREPGVRVEIDNPSSMDNGDFLVWGHDNASAVDLVEDSVIQGVSTHYDRVWRVQETGDIGTVSVHFDSTGITLATGLTRDQIVLVVGEDDAFFESNIYEAGSLSDLTLTYENVDFTDARYFMLGLERSVNINLGGIFADLRLWLDADDESTLHTDSACTSGPPSDGDEIQCWEDKSPFDSHVTQVSGDGVPEFLEDDFSNSTNTLYFQQSEEDVLRNTLGSDSWTAEDFTFFIVLRQVTNPGTFWSFFSNGTSSNSDHFQLDIVQSGSGDSEVDRYRVNGLSQNRPVYGAVDFNTKLYSFIISDGDEQNLSLYSDGSFVTQEEDIDETGRQFTHYNINQNRVGRRYNDAEISEVIIYDNDIGLCDLKMISGYLGVKYGQAFGGGVPGGIDCRNVVLWHVVDTFSEQDGGAVERLIDQGPFEYHVDQATADSRPTYNEDAINNLDSMTFDGVDDFLTSSQDDLTFGDSERHYFFSLNYTDGDGGTFLSHGTSGTGTEVNLGLDDDSIFIDLGGQVLGVDNILTENVHFLRFSYYNNPDISGWYISVDGEIEVEAEELSGSPVTIDTPAGSLAWGRSVDEDDYYTGTLIEGVFYAANLPQRIIESTQTYFALRIGVTIDSDQNYVDSSGIIMYETGGEYDDFLHDIAGFGADNVQNLQMAASRSASSDSLMEITAVDEESISNEEYLLWGNDNGLFKNSKANLPSEVSSRFERIWRFKENGDVGDVSITFDLSDLIVISETADDIKLIVDSDDDFTSGATVIDADSLSDDVVQFDSVSLEDGDYVSLAVTIGDLSVDIVDDSVMSISSPVIDFGEMSFSHSSVETTSTFGTDDFSILIENQTPDSQWTLYLSAESPDSLWEGENYSLDFNDVDGATDGLDVDTAGGQMTIDPSVATITPSTGCSSDALSLGSEASFSEGVIDSISLLSAASSAEIDCSWEITGIQIAQVVPANQYSDDYSLGLVLTAVAD